MDRIDTHVREELGRLGSGVGDGEIAGIARAWPAAVGATVARNAWPARLGRDGTLHVNAVSATWAFELGRMAAEILAQLRSELGGAAPVALRVAPGPVPDPSPERATGDGAQGLEIVAQDRLEGDALAAAIGDDELRGLVARAAAASLARARSDRGF